MSGGAKVPRITRDKSTPERAAFWERVERDAAEVATWPAWQRAGSMTRTPGSGPMGEGEGR